MAGINSTVFAFSTNDVKIRSVDVTMKAIIWRFVACLYPIVRQKTLASTKWDFLVRYGRNSRFFLLLKFKTQYCIISLLVIKTGNHKFKPLNSSTQGPLVVSSSQHCVFPSLEIKICFGNKKFNTFIAQRKRDKDCPISFLATKPGTHSQLYKLGRYFVTSFLATKTGTHKFRGIHSCINLTDTL